jgi:hypothetical protein
MKNKLLLLCCFIIPSFCFSKSVCVNLLYTEEDNVIQFNVASSVKINETPITFAEKLQTDSKGYVWFKDNNKAIYSITRKLAFILSKEQLGALMVKMTQPRWSLTDIHIVIETEFIHDGYAVTHKEFDILDGEKVTMHKHVWYFYKS